MSNVGNKKIGRRQLLAGAAVGAAGYALGACTAPPTSTQATKAPSGQQPAGQATAAPSAAPKTAPPAQGAAKFNWKMQSAWGASDWHQHNPTQFAAKVKEMSDGRLNIEVLPAGAVVPAAELLDAVNKGILDACNSWPGYWYGKNTAFTLFGSIPGGPFGMNNEDYLAWLFLGGGLDMYNELLQKEMKLDLICFPSFGETPEPLGWFNKQIKSIKDFEGLKFRAAGISGEVFKSMGMQVVTLAGGEIVPALERGTIDAAEYSDPTSDMTNGFHEVVQYYHLPSVHQPTGIMENLIKKSKWDQLPADLKAIVKYAAMAETLEYTLEMADRNANDLLTLVEKHNVKVVKSPLDIQQEILKGWDIVAKQKAAENPTFAKIYESQRKWAQVRVPYRLLGHPDYKTAAEYYWGTDNVYKPL